MGRVRADELREQESRRRVPRGFLRQLRNRAGVGSHGDVGAGRHGAGRRARDFFTACYSFVKGLSQLLAGIMSDRIGRKAPMCLGLLGGAAALLVAAVGAGWRGRVSVGVGVDPDELKQLQFAYLCGSPESSWGSSRASCTRCSPPPRRITRAGRLQPPGTAGTVRFWRDLGYAMGLPTAAADASRPRRRRSCSSRASCWSRARRCSRGTRGRFGGEKHPGGTGPEPARRRTSRVDEQVMRDERGGRARLEAGNAGV